MDRRKFFKVAGITSAGMLLSESFKNADNLLGVADKKGLIKPISGSWFEFQHLLASEGEYWDGDLAKFTERQWKEKIREISEIGFEYLVLQEVADKGKTYYPSELQPKYEMGCDDPLEAILSEADKVGIKFFIPNGFWDDCQRGKFLITDPDIRKLRIRGMEEFVKKYGHHKCFYGWYFPNEAYLLPYFSEEFVKYMNDCAYVAKQLTPECVNIIAPYNIKAEKCDDHFVKQLERMNIEIIAYQDGVGVNATRLGEAGRYFEALYNAHQKASRSRIWADMELFYFEDGTKGNLLPADFDARILKQMQDISPFVDKILCYQYIGCMNKPGTGAYAGNRNRESERLYRQYTNWLKKRK
ncbi:MAG: DUF4434 domain-containing protein [Bacteroidales bacterium]|nr:DUF4434 domain-containing protein [Bacteroidales bacterium]